jgi:hypothetical protein
VQTVGVDYSVSGQTVTFLSSDIPVAGDVLQAYYRITSGTSATFNFADAEIPTGTINGTNVTFALAAAPNPVISLKLYKNGMLLQQPNDYTLSGSTITFVSAAAPQTGDSITAYYRH